MFLAPFEHFSSCQYVMIHSRLQAGPCDQTFHYSIAWTLPVASCKEMPFSFQTMVILVIAHIAEVFIVLVLARCSIAEIYNFLYIWQFLLEMRQCIRNECMHSGSIMPQAIRNNAHTETFDFATVAEINRKGVNSCLAVVPMVTLDSILHNKTVVFCKVWQYNDFILWNVLLQWFQVCWLGFVDKVMGSEAMDCVACCLNRIWYLEVAVHIETSVVLSADHVIIVNIIVREQF